MPVSDAVRQTAAVVDSLVLRSEVQMDLAGQNPSNRPLTVIIVEPFLPDSLLAVSALSEAGFHVTVAEGFVEARALLTSCRPSLLLADIQLRDYNGLHLVLHGKAIRADMAAVITARRPDAALESETARLGATFVRMPTTEAELLAAVLRTLMRATDDSTVISAPFERRTRTRRSTDQRLPAEADKRVADRRRPLAALTGGLVSRDTAAP